MKRSGTLILLGLPTALVLIAWPASYHWHYINRSNSPSPAFAGAVDTSSIALWRGEIFLYLQRPGPDQQSDPERIRSSHHVYNHRGRAICGLELAVKDVAADFAPWTPQGPAKTYRQVSARIPFYIPAILLAVPLGIVLWRGAVRRRRRRTKGLCVQCGYDLTGNVTGVCSECGVPAGVA